MFSENYYFLTQTNKRPWVAHLSKLAKGQTHHLNKPDYWSKDDLDLHCNKSLCTHLCNCIYRIVLKYWDTQRIGTSLKIVKIIILADPKNWAILRKRKNIRNFSGPKNWDGVYGAPKWSKTCMTLLVYNKRCPHVLSPHSLVNKGDTAKNDTVIMFFNAVLPQGIYLNEIPASQNVWTFMCYIKLALEHPILMSMCNSPLFLLLEGHVLSRDHVIVTCIFA